METPRKTVQLTDEAHALLERETKVLWADSLKALASRIILLALKDKTIYEALIKEFRK
jgi:hypothetical protein